MASRSQPFRPRFTLMLFYVALFFFVYALLFALPGLVAGARELGPGPGELSPEELAQAKEITQRALGGGKLFVALAASLATVGFAAWRRALPGMR
jgi:hypothetical protein